MKRPEGIVSEPAKSAPKKGSKKQFVRPPGKAVRRDSCVGVDLLRNLVHVDGITLLLGLLALFTAFCAVKQCNKCMGGVDLSDVLIKYYTVDRKISRWYMKTFLHLIDIAVVNSFIIHKEMAEAKGEKPMKQKRFRLTLLEQLGSVGKVSAQACTSREAAVGVTVSLLVLPEKHCLPVPVCQLSSDPAQKATLGRRRCVRCQRCTIYKCEKCDVPLCIVADRICFTLWHKDPDSREY